MQNNAALPPPPRPAFTAASASWPARLRRLWNSLAQDGDERLLCAAADLADLERRLRRLEQGRTERFDPLPRLP